MSLLPRLYGISTRIILAGALVALLPAAVANSSAGDFVSLVSDTGDQIELEFGLKDLDLTSVNIDGQKFSLYKISGAPFTKELGAPCVPHVANSIIIPDDAAMTLSVDLETARYYDVTDVDLVPSRGYIPRSINPDQVPYEFGSEYSQNAFYPGELATLSDPYILRDYRGAVVDVFPVQYNPVTRTLRVYTNLTITVQRSGPAKINPLDRPRSARALSTSFHNIYNGHFLNYTPDQRYDPMDEDGDMLIICYDSWLSNIQSLVDHKNAIGITTTAVGVSTIGNNSTSIQSYIQSVYNSSDLAFVLLVGDASQVATPERAGGAADPDYSLLAGSDNYPDIIVGRFSASSSSEVDTQVLRTIEYEEMPATTADWFWRGVGIASDQGTGDDGETDEEHIENIRDDLLGYGYTLVSQVYEASGASASDISAALNAGRGIINYCGHGSATSWSTTGYSNSNVNSLVNNNMLPFVVSVACNNGEFDNYSACFAESWLRATNGSEPTGAACFYGSSISQPWDPPMEAQDEINYLYVNESYVTYGALCYAGSCSMMDEYTGSGDTWGTGPATFNTWIIFGDPSLRVVGTTAPPTGLSVSPSGGLAAEGSTGGPFTPSSADYTLENQNTTAISYEVTKSASWISVTNASGAIPGGGSVVVTVSINSQANSLGNGYYSDTVYFNNLTDGDGDATRLVELTVGVPTLQYEWNMDTNPGWSTEGQWAWGQPTGGGGDHGNPDPTSGYTGNYVYGYNLSGDYAGNISEYDLTTNAIDCSELTDVSLKFYRWLGVEQPYYDHAYLRISNDGSSFTTIWENTAEVADDSWELQEFDISQYADQEATVYIQWVMGEADGYWHYCGWNVDDVEIWGLAPAEPEWDMGDMNCDGQVNFDDIDPFVLALVGQSEYEAAWPACEWMNADADDSGIVNFDDIDGFVEALTGG